MGSLLDELQEKVTVAEERIDRTRNAIDVFGAIAMGAGIVWAIWAAFRKSSDSATPPPSA